MALVCALSSVITSRGHVIELFWRKKTNCNLQACLVRGKGRKPSEWWAMDVVEAWSAGASDTAELGEGQGAGDGRLAIGPAVVWVFKA